MLDLRSEVYALLAQQFSVPSSEIRDDQGPDDIPAWDSLGHIQLITELESVFSVELLVDDTMAMETVGDILTILARLVSSGEMNRVAQSRSTRHVAAGPLRMPQVTHCGVGALANLRHLACDDMAVLTGSSTYTVGLIERIKELLPQETRVHFICRPPGEPTEESVGRVVEELRSRPPDIVLAVGGGSTIDTAKLACLLLAYPEYTLGDIAAGADLRHGRDGVGLVAVPTIFGSGAEVSSASIFSSGVAATKTIILSDVQLPDKVILDPSLSEGVPLAVACSGAFDALTHAIEGYVSTLENQLVKPYAVAAVRELLTCMPRLCSDGVTREVLQPLCFSAYFAGVVQNHMSVGVTHAIAHQLARVGIGHGQANAMLLTTVIEFNAAKADCYDGMVRDCNLGSLEDVVGTIDSLFESVNLLPDRVVLERVLELSEEIADDALKDPTVRTNPVPVEREDVMKILRDCLAKYL